MLVGGPKVSPIKIADAEKNSAYWRATEMQSPDVALFFLAASRPDLLKNAPGHEKRNENEERCPKPNLEVEPTEDEADDTKCERTGHDR